MDIRFQLAIFSDLDQLKCKVEYRRRLNESLMIDRLLCHLVYAGVVPEYQCAVKREAKKAQKEKDRPNSSSLGSPEMKEPEVKVVHHQQQPQLQQQQQQQPQQQHIHVIKPTNIAVDPSRCWFRNDNFHQLYTLPFLYIIFFSDLIFFWLGVDMRARATSSRVCAQVVDEKPMVVCGGAPSGGSNGLAVKPLSPEQEELINRLVYFQEEFDQPSEEDLRKISVSRWLMKVKMLICMLILATTCVVI